MQLITSILVLFGSNLLSTIGKVHSLRFCNYLPIARAIIPKLHWNPFYYPYQFVHYTYVLKEGDLNSNGVVFACFFF